VNTKNLSKRVRLTSVGATVFGDVRYAPGGIHQAEQQVHQLVHIVHGHADVVYGRKSFGIGPGAVGLVTPGERVRYAFAREQETRHTWCSLAGLPSTGALARELEQFTATARPLSERLATLMEIGLSLGQSVAERSPGLVVALAQTCLETWLEDARCQLLPGGGEPPALTRALEWIAQQSHAPCNLAGLARHVGVSPTVLQGLFRDHLATTPMRYLWHQRTERGLRLLRETGLTVGEIATQCGFQTPFHFSRWVRQITGHSPRQIRQSSNPLQARSQQD